MDWAFAICRGTMFEHEIVNVFNHKHIAYREARKVVKPITGKVFVIESTHNVLKSYGWHYNVEERKWIKL